MSFQDYNFGHVLITIVLAMGALAFIMSENKSAGEKVNVYEDGPVRCYYLNHFDSSAISCVVMPEEEEK